MTDSVLVYIGQTISPLGHMPVVTIFVVDDDLLMRTAMEMLLTSVGYRVQLFENGFHFLEFATKDMPGCIILDVRMPGLSGLEVQQRLNDARIYTPIIFVSGNGDIPMAVKAIKAHAVEFLPKPFREQDLLDAVGSAIEYDAWLREGTLRRAEASRMLARLTPREREIFNGLSEGLPVNKLAERYDLSEATVKCHRRKIMQKLGIEDVGHLIGFAAVGRIPPRGKAALYL